MLVLKILGFFLLALVVVIVAVVVVALGYGVYLARVGGTGDEGSYGFSDP